MQEIAGQGRSLPGDTYTCGYFDPFSDRKGVIIQVRPGDVGPMATGGTIHLPIAAFSGARWWLDLIIFFTRKYPAVAALQVMATSRALPAKDSCETM